MTPTELKIYPSSRAGLGLTAADRRREHVRELRRLRSFTFRALKATLGCDRCGHDDPDDLQFHHRAGEVKLFNPTREPCRSDAAIRAELAKCRVLCTTCHRSNHGPDDE